MYVLALSCQQNIILCIFIYFRYKKLIVFIYLVFMFILLTESVNDGGFVFY